MPVTSITNLMVKHLCSINVACKAKEVGLGRARECAVQIGSAMLHAGKCSDVATVG